MRRHSLRLVLVAALALCAPGIRPAAEEPAASAIVLGVKGGAWLVESSPASETVLQPLVWLAPGETIRTGANGEVTIVTASGTKQGLGPKALAVVHPEGLTAKRGEVRTLGTVQRCPPITDIASGLPSARAATAAAFVTRGTGCPVITYLASHVTIGFPCEEGKSYVVTVKDGHGRMAFSARAASAPVAVPPEDLARGAAYSWEVGVAEEGGTRPLAHGIFCTLDARREEERQELVRQVQRSKEPDLLLLLAAYDASAGLLCEACEEIGQAGEQGAEEASHHLLAHRLECDCCPSRQGHAKSP